MSLKHPQSCFARAKENQTWREEQFLHFLAVNSQNVGFMFRHLSGVGVGIGVWFVVTVGELTEGFGWCQGWEWFAFLTN